jgi:hypothetical protein
MANDGEKLAEKVERMTNELDAMKRKMLTCKHEFGKPVVTIKEVITDAIFDHYEPHGSDPEPIYRYIKGKEYGWTKTCDICGYQEYTAKTKPIVKGYEPDFGR